MSNPKEILPPKLDENYEAENHTISTKIGSLIFGVFKSFNEKISKTVKDDSYIELSNNEAAQSKVRLSAGGQVLIKSSDSLAINSANNIDISVKGVKQEVIAGDSKTMVKGNTVHVDGSQTKEQQDAANEIYKSHVKIQEARLKALDKKGEMVACPICNTKHAVDKKSDIVDGTFAFIRKYVPSFCSFNIDLFQWLSQTLVSPFLSIVNNIGLSESKGCGSSGCKGGMVESPVSKMKAADAASKTALKQESDNLTKQSQKISGGSIAKSIPGDVITKIGLKKNDLKAYKNLGVTIPYGFSWKPSRTVSGNLYMSSEGTTDTVAFTPPAVQENGGSIMLDVCQKFTINAGSPGIDFLSTGRFNVQSGDIVMTATEGEAVFGSGNKTTIKGKNVFIDADDKSGQSGFGIQARNTMIHGSLNVRGDAAFKGHLTTDGAISTPYLIVPSMRAKTTLGANSRFVQGTANWSYAGASLQIVNLAKDILTKYSKLDYLTQPVTGAINLTMEFYNCITHKFPVDGITGIFVGTCALGPCAGFIFNFPHSHTNTGSDHFHEFSSPKASYWNNRKGWGEERMAGSPIPTPAPAMGDNVSPGPFGKSGGCGGGGLYTKNRNENYNLNIDDPNGGLDYIPLNIKRNPDGDLIPTPRSSFIYGISTGSINSSSTNNSTPPPYNTNTPKPTTEDC